MHRWASHFLNFFPTAWAAIPKAPYPGLVPSPHTEPPCQGGQPAPQVARRPRPPSGGSAPSPHTTTPPGTPPGQGALPQPPSFPLIPSQPPQPPQPPGTRPRLTWGPRAGGSLRGGALVPMAAPDRPGETATGTRMGTAMGTGTATGTGEAPGHRGTAAGPRRDRPEPQAPPSAGGWARGRLRVLGWRKAGSACPRLASTPPGGAGSWGGQLVGVPS